MGLSSLLRAERPLTHLPLNAWTPRRQHPEPLPGRICRTPYLQVLPAQNALDVGGSLRLESLRPSAGWDELRLLAHSPLAGSLSDEDT